MNPRILLIDDDRRLAEMVSRYLAQSGMVVEHRGDAATGFAAIETAVPDLLLLDLMLPDADGLDVCRRLREPGSPARSVPILMLTARGEITDRVVGLEIGADDYLPKPFEPRELLARVRALLRRANPPADAASDPASIVSTGSSSAGSADAARDEERRCLRLGSLEVDVDAREVRVRGVSRNLTAYQFDLLAALAANAGRVMSRERLMDLVKGEQLEAFDRSIDVHVGRIRLAIEDDPKHPRRLLTVRGAGYVMTRQPVEGDPPLG